MEVSKAEGGEREAGREGRGGANRNSRRGGRGGRRGSASSGASGGHGGQGKHHDKGKEPSHEKDDRGGGKGGKEKGTGGGGRRRPRVDRSRAGNSSNSGGNNSSSKGRWRKNEKSGGASEQQQQQQQQQNSNQGQQGNQNQGQGQQQLHQLGISQGHTLGLHASAVDGADQNRRENDNSPSKDGSGPFMPSTLIGSDMSLGLGQDFSVPDMGSSLNLSFGGLGLSSVGESLNFDSALGTALEADFATFEPLTTTTRTESRLGDIFKDNRRSSSVADEQPPPPPPPSSSTLSQGKQQQYQQQSLHGGVGPGVEGEVLQQQQQQQQQGNQPDFLHQRQQHHEGSGGASNAPNKKFVILRRNQASSGANAAPSLSSDVNVVAVASHGLDGRRRQENEHDNQPSYQYGHERQKNSRAVNMMNGGAGGRQNGGRAQHQNTQVSAHNVKVLGVSPGIDGAMPARVSEGPGGDMRSPSGVQNTLLKLKSTPTSGRANPAQSREDYKHGGSNARDEDNSASRRAKQQQQQQQQHSNGGKAPARDGTEKSRRSRNRDKKQEKKNKQHQKEMQQRSDADPAEAKKAPRSAAKQIEEVAKVEVSITSSTKTKSNKEWDEAAAAAAAAEAQLDPDLQSTGHAMGHEGRTQVLLKSDASGGAVVVGVGSRRKAKGRNANSPAKPLTPAEQFAQQQRQFNMFVRGQCERSAIDKVVALLEDPVYAGCMLDSISLEITMKTFVVAAQFEQALKCLKHNATPDTLGALQTERILASLPQNLRNSSAFTAADMINALCIATNFKNGQTARAYFLRIVRGIALEFLEEATSARDRICSAPCERLVRTGQCVVDAKLRKGRRETEIQVQPGHQLGVFIPEIMDSRGIQAGDAVSILPYAGPYPMSAESLDRNMVEATVTSANPLVIRLHDKTNRQLQRMLTDPAEGNVYRIDKLANRMGFNRQLEAARIVAAPPENAGHSNAKKNMQRPSEELVTAITAMDENIDNIMLGATNGNFNQSAMEVGTTSTAEICSHAVPLEGNSADEDEDNIRAYSLLALEKTGQLEGLNSSQRLAVHQAVTNRLTLVQGPPGTGKTAVAIKIMSHWAKTSNSPVLATSDSNIAVDNLVEGCAKAGLTVVRLGRPEAIRPELLKYCVDKPGAAAHSIASGQGDIRTAGIEGLEGGTYGGITNSNASGAQIFKEKMRAIKKAQIVCCTCIGSGGEILDGMFFDRVLVDEATQATEPATLVPLTRGCKQLVLVGDHCQLPPTVLSTRAEEEGLGVPLFSRMVACGVPPCMLDTQYRMHPAIATFPSDLFYGGKLLNGVSPPERRPLAGFPWPREEFPVAFLPINEGIEVDDGVSKMNEAEAQAACNAVQCLLEGGCSVSDVAVVTPYAAQVRLIKRMTRQLVSRPPYVEVSSVDGFQGREKEAVIFSAVRSNDHGSVGFVSDWRRVNVSFTRARRALIVIGNDVCLRRGDVDTWSPWISWADSQGINMNFPGKPRGRYDAEQLRRVRGGTTAAEMLKDVLERQQAQLKTAEVEQKRAIKQGRNVLEEFEGKQGDIMGPRVGHHGTEKVKEEVKLVGNFESNWDDSSEDEEDAGKADGEDGNGGREEWGESILRRADDVKEEEDSGTGGLRDGWDDDDED